MLGLAGAILGIFAGLLLSVVIGQYPGGFGLGSLYGSVLVGGALEDSGSRPGGTVSSRLSDRRPAALLLRKCPRGRQLCEVRMSGAVDTTAPNPGRILGGPISPNRWTAPSWRGAWKMVYRMGSESIQALAGVDADDFYRRIHFHAWAPRARARRLFSMSLAA